MATKSDTFERKEKKYLISQEQASALKAALGAKMRLDDYGATRIDSLYLDTEGHDLIIRSLEKPLYKEKIRIRSYGAYSQADKVFVELKKKFKGVVYKRRVAMSAEAARAFTAGMRYEDAVKAFPLEDGNDPLDPGKLQIAREIEAFLARHDGLKPAMVISCMREAWCPIDPDDTDCVDRITFDESLRYIDLFEQNSVQRRNVVSDQLVVMEIKCAGGYPQWLCDLLASCGAYPRSFSKYGNAYKRVMAERGAVSVDESQGDKAVVKGIPSRTRSREDVRRPILRTLFGKLRPTAANLA